MRAAEFRLEFKGLGAPTSSISPMHGIHAKAVWPLDAAAEVGGLDSQPLHLHLPWGRLFAKGVGIGMGRDHDENYNDSLRDLIAAGRIRPSEIVSHRLPLRLPYR
jgi:threonine dehydrogenase-like Zn-dependent dehydrogenase